MTSPGLPVCKQSGLAVYSATFRPKVVTSQWGTRCIHKLQHHIFDNTQNAALGFGCIVDAKTMLNYFSSLCQCIFKLFLSNFLIQTGSPKQVLCRLISHLKTIVTKSIKYTLSVPAIS